MMTQEAGRLAVFLHLPKCGGKSMEQLLIRNYGLEHVIRLYWPGRRSVDAVLPGIPPAKRISATLMYGHIPYGTGEKIGRECCYFTVLRDSTSRFLSFYRYVKYDFVHHELHQALNSGRMGISDLCCRNRFPFTRNVMTKFLAGYEPGEEEQPFMLRQAMEHLDSMPAFGLTEYYAESVAWLSHVFAWHDREIGHANISTVSGQRMPEMEAVGPVEIQCIREANWMDDALYCYAKKRFLAMRESNHIESH